MLSKWLHRKMEKNNCFLIDLWFFTAFPLVMIMHLKEQNWIQVGLFLFVAALVYSMRTVAKYQFGIMIQRMQKSRIQKIALTEMDFHLLVCGRTVEIYHPDHQAAHIILKDIGFERMQRAINVAKSASEKVEQTTQTVQY